jgi:flagella basal body P-ring formation protein FlgA
MPCRILLPLLLLTASAGVAFAQAVDAITDLAQLRATALDTAATYTGRPAAQLDVATLDPRLRLLACPTPLAGKVTPGARTAARLTIEVSCAEPAWRVFVPVRIVARERVVVAARTLAPRTALTSADLEVVERELGSLTSGYFRQPDELLGSLPVRALGAGEVLTPALVRPGMLVRRGQRVTLLAQAAGLTVRMAGEAQSDGGLNQRIRVRNLSSERQVEGVVRSADTVEIGL